MINSILDTDKYKLTMQQAVLKLHPDAFVSYSFKNRRSADQFTPKMFDEICTKINDLENIQLSYDEAQYLREDGAFYEDYIQYLLKYRFNADQISIKLDSWGHLYLDVEGPWHETILWEVPLMYIISEAYFSKRMFTWKEVIDKTIAKSHFFEENKLNYYEFGTRRRRSEAIQSMVVHILSDREGEHFKGTSNLNLARTNGIPCFGSVAHEWFQGTSGLYGLANANFNALMDWRKVYPNNLKVALPDTFTTPIFMKDFTRQLADHYVGIRQDSGDPISFAENWISWFEKNGIDPTERTIYFSDGLNPDKCLEIHNAIDGRIGEAYCLGTNFTNDIDHSPALNMVIKLKTIAARPGQKTTDVVKLGDGIGKESGNLDAISQAKKELNIP